MTTRYLARLGIPSLSALAVCGLAASAFAQSSTVIIAPSAPPPPRVETAPPPPPGGQVMTWEPGHWAWTGGNWAWVDGQYRPRPQPTAQYEPGHWQQQPTGGYVWVEGHWRS